MGDFRIVINATGYHGRDRSKKNGEVVDFKDNGENSPEVIAQKCVEALKAAGCIVDNAKIVHWPYDNAPEQRKEENKIEDDLLTGIRTGSFL